jgi:hypothetical protein
MTSRCARAALLRAAGRRMHLVPGPSRRPASCPGRAPGRLRCPLSLQRVAALPSCGLWPALRALGQRPPPKTKAAPPPRRPPPHTHTTHTAPSQDGHGRDGRHAARVRRRPARRRRWQHPDRRGPGRARHAGRRHPPAQGAALAGLRQQAGGRAGARRGGGPCAQGGRPGWLRWRAGCMQGPRSCSPAVGAPAGGEAAGGSGWGRAGRLAAAGRPRRCASAGRRQQAAALQARGPGRQQSWMHDLAQACARRPRPTPRTPCAAQLGEIPPNSTLDVDIELLSIKTSPLGFRQAAHFRPHVLPCPPPASGSGATRPIAPCSASESRDSCSHGPR